MPSHRDTARQFPWDRLMSVVLGNNIITLGAGVFAAQWTNYVTYTVPAGFKAYIDVFGCRIRTTAVGVGGVHGARVAIVAGAVTSPLAIVQRLDGAIGEEARWDTQAGYIGAGNALLLDACKTIAGADVLEIVEYYKATQFQA